MESSFTLLRVRGIVVGAHWSWLVVVTLVAWSLAAGVFPAAYPELGGATYLAMSLVATAVLFASVLLHELGHAFRALAEGTPIRGITLWLFGGVAHLAGAPGSAGAELRVAACGPLVSLGLAVAFGLASRVVRALGAPIGIEGVLAYLAQINFLLMGFNLVPAFPLDGGRVLRSWLWRRGRTYSAATLSAARAGRVFGILLVGLGVLDVFTGEGDGGGLWIALLGLFLVRAAGLEATVARAGQAGQEVVSDTASTSVPETGGEESRPRRRRGNLLVWVVVGSAMATAVAALYRPPYMVISPGSAIPIGDDIVISGVPVDELNGRFLLTTVYLVRPSALTLAWSALQDHHEIRAVSDFVPPGVSPGEYGRMQRRVFVESRRLAAAAAARAVGMEVVIKGSGAAVIGLVEGSPAARVLRIGDVVVSIDGRPVTTSAELGETVRSRPVGSRFQIGIERRGRGSVVAVESRPLEHLSGRPGIGVATETHDLQVDLPFEVSFKRQDIGGPSAGLAYALTIADLLDPGDFAKGRAVAATGTIDIDGLVGAVGGVKQKAVAVETSRADMFLVPGDEVDQARRVGLVVRGATTLEEALAELAQA
ncbi:MAG: site-2 protease family protein [Acidimicrobiia bacterium]